MRYAVETALTAEQLQKLLGSVGTVVEDIYVVVAESLQSTKVVGPLLSLEEAERECDSIADASFFSKLERP